MQVEPRRPSQIAQNPHLTGRASQEKVLLMTTTTAESPIMQKTKELCQTIVEHPDFQVVRQQIDSFMADEKARGQYEVVVQKGELLNQKQQQGLRLSNEEIADFESQREALVHNPVAKGFLDAQQEMHKMQESVSQFVAKTFELGRVPEPEDMDSGSCGHGCGCHH